MNILGIGNDIIKIDRIAHSIERYGKRFIDKIFTKNEQAYCDHYGNSAVRHYAGRFSAKEAVVKALGTGFSGGIEWHDIEILNNNAGKPYVVAGDIITRKFGCVHIMISLSHCNDYASAVAIVTTSPPQNNVLKGANPIQ